MDDEPEGTRQRHAGNRLRKAAGRCAKRVMVGESGGVIMPGANMSKDEFISALQGAAEEVKDKFPIT